jgi:hypothetical protein
MSDQDVFDDDPVEETEEVESTESEKGEQVEAKPETEEQDTTEETPSSDTKTVPLSAMIAVRKELQETKARLEEQSKSKPDPVTDPEGYDTYQESQRLTDKIRLAEDLAKDAYPDFDEKKDTFLSLVTTRDEEGNVRVTDEGLYQKFLSSPNPAKFAYNHAKDHLDYVEKSSSDYEQKIKQQYLNELREKGLLAVDADELPDFANAADVQSNNSLESKGDPDRIDVFD